MTDPALEMTVGWIGSYEGFRSEPYLDQGGVPTIGFGFTYLVDGSRVTMQTPAMTRADADARLSDMVGRVLTLVRGMVHVPISNHAACALTSMAYNCGTNALRTSTLLRLLNSGETENAAKCFGSWVYDAGRIDPGMVQRRKNEATLFLTPDVPRSAAAETAEGISQKPQISATLGTDSQPEGISPTTADLNAAELANLNPAPEQT